MRAQRVDRARVRVEQDVVGRERGLGQPEPHVGRRIDVLVAGIGNDEHDEPIEPELGLRATRQLDMSTVRRVERTAEEPQHGPRRPHQASSNSSSPISTVAPSFAPAARSARSSSSSVGGVPRTRNPSSVRSRRQPRTFGCGR